MKFYSFFALFLAFYEVETFSRGVASKALRNALVNISDHLAANNQSLTVAVVGNISHQTIESATFASTASIPHLAFKIEERFKECIFDSSAIVLLDSTESLQRFNRKVICLCPSPCRSKCSSTFNPDHTLI